MLGNINFQLYASIDESRCIGCTHCIKACPFDSIVGAAKLMHTVITDLCTGCGLCVEPCPVDCIEMRSWPTDSIQLPLPEATQAAEQRRARRNMRLARKQKPKLSLSDTNARQNEINAAYARVLAKRISKA
jgi:electron transport complex protein RnfB